MRDSERARLQAKWITKEGRNHNLWYSSAGKFIRLPEGDYLSKDNVEDYLRVRGYIFKSNPKDPPTLVPDGKIKKQEIIHDFRFDHLVKTCSCWDQGLHQYEGHYYLVLKNPKRLEPKEGDWSAIDTLLEDCFPKDRDYWEAWYCLSVQGYYHPDQFRPGPLLVMMGTGHDFIQEHLINAAFGPSINPFHYYLERGHKSEILSTSYSWAIESAATQVIDKEKRERFSKLLGICASVKQMNYKLPMHIRGSVCANVTDVNKQLLGEYVFGDRPDLLVIHCEGQGGEVKKIKTHLSAYLWHMLHRYQIPTQLLTREIEGLEMPGPFKTGYFSSWLRDACFQLTPECCVLDWLVKLYVSEKAQGSMNLPESFIPSRLELAGIPKWTVSLLSKERSLHTLMGNLSLRYPKNFWLIPDEKSVVWRLSNLNQLVSEEAAA